MNKMNLVSMAVFLLTSVSAFATVAPEQILELTRANGQGLVFDQVTITTDGVVTHTSQGVSQVVKTLSASDVASLEKTIASIPHDELVQTNPKQFYNPGGFTKKFILTDSSGASFTFAENISGVDFGLANSQGQDLAQLLDQADSE